jgi:sulfur carrier protein
MEKVQVKNIQVNSEKTVCQSKNLAELLIELGYGEAVVATALNGNFVAQGNRVNASLDHGDQVEILAPMQGG